MSGLIDRFRAKGPFTGQATLGTARKARRAFGKSPFHSFDGERRTIDHLDDVALEIARLACRKAGRAPKGELLAVLKGFAVAIIDPKCVLIDFLLSLGCFKPGGELAKRTWLFDLADPGLTPRLTPWGLAGGVDFNQTVDAFYYLVGEVGKAGVSARQKTVMGHFLRLMTVWPGATLDTLRRALKKPELAKHHLHDLPSKTAEFFREIIDGDGLGYVDDVTDALYWRVDGLQSFEEFDRLLNNAEATFDPPRVLNDGALVLIRLPQAKLSTQQQGDLGRALLAMTSGVINQRYAAGDLDSFIPGDVIIDECQMVFQGSDDTVARNILSTARGAGWGLTLMHQNLGQLFPEIEAAVMANCGTKVIGKCEAKAAKTFADNMHCPSNIFPNVENDGDRHFVVHSNGMIDAGTICHAPQDDFADVGRLTDDEHAALTAGFRARFSDAGEAAKVAKEAEQSANIVDFQPMLKQPAVPL